MNKPWFMRQTLVETYREIDRKKIQSQAKDFLAYRRAAKDAASAIVWAELLDSDRDDDCRLMADYNHRANRLRAEEE